MNQPFDAQGFFAALNAHRESKGLTWKQVASKTGVAASTLTRMGQGKRPDVDGLASLASWSGIDVRKFYRLGEQGDAEPLAEITTILRADKNLEQEAVKALEVMLKTAYQQMRRKDDET
ncbi:helix-turn-helix domain-containing protein [Rhodophyticola porphyridii]|uniref:XRE family transcriptional regulator n=1 Tax=Rhodophyticola porphyridii TaxID=1852017 RepID=A0A3L9Y4Q0_9RHOB|nr:helix-turn-helix domain-containing protein [Rhodophyticola porphyridii]RMA41106.1 XRE family transcriptional regulator [Rhodophyticola porphyridii]